MFRTCRNKFYIPNSTDMGRFSKTLWTDSRFFQLQPMALDKGSTEAAVVDKTSDFFLTS